jgi:transposase-like protein
VARIGKAYQKFSEEYKRLAVDRMQSADSVVELARELGIRRNLLYKWEAKLKGRKPEETARRPVGARSASETEQALREEIRQLREALGKRSQEIDFFKGALQKIEARRQSEDSSGASASTTKSGK